VTVMRDPIAIARWTHDGDEVLILKCVPRDGRAYNGFVWPLTVGAAVEAPDFDAAPACGNGLHGWPWGFAIGDGRDPDWRDGQWLVFGSQPADVVDLGGKVKARAGVVRFVGAWWEATDFVLAGQMAWVAHAAHGAASATGERGAASATGERGAASATGWSGAASATGERGAASATGWRGAASATGESSSAAVTGADGRAQAGPYGCLALSWWNPAAGRCEMRCAEVGCGDGSDGKLKAHTWYVLDEHGVFTEAP